MCADIIGNKISIKTIKEEILRLLINIKFHKYKNCKIFEHISNGKKKLMMKISLTGDSKGLGESIKNKLNESGYNIIGLSRNSNDIKYDLRNVDGIKQLYLKILKNRGPIYGFINNAVYAYDDIITNLNSKKLIDMYNVNVFSPMMLTKYVIRDMILNKTKGSIIHISSISVHTGYMGLAMYASSKGSLEAFSKNTSREWGRLELGQISYVLGLWIPI